MTPTLVHRYTWPVREAIEHLLGGAAGDCDAWRIRIEGDEVVIDVVGPAEVSLRVGEYEYTVDGRAQSTSEAEEKINTATAAPVEPPRKGGPLARQAGIICGEKGFWTFLAKKYGMTIASVDEAAKCLKALCSVESRIDFDYDEGKAASFRDIDKSYRLWLEGYD
ncbi:hypothetical protein [Mesorhizobium sp. B2-3-6]|uniref:hypothetical protein n=1 Tax=Mesorhizobium sp. B2-3-6 TaxID=2589957 RepID=UPI001127A4C5|nr:hypothetical protein [Mesorhizobium sp. B2-3-6]TPM19830.1 hypothetical protein FJ953_15655 [Mesorhizobium sp. B2-3-6]